MKKLENFEKEFEKEIHELKGLRFERVEVPEFRAPSYNFFYAKALSLAFAIPALAVVFGFLFMYHNGNSQENQDLAQIEASNERILNQINTLDYE